MLWEMFKHGKVITIVCADSFDEAIEKARRIDPDICAGRRVWED